MDEPFGALDPFTRRHVRRELFGLNELQETTVVLVTHDVGEALELADRIALMDQGRSRSRRAITANLKHWNTAKAASSSPSASARRCG